MNALYQRALALLLRWLRIPPEPHPPHGDPASLRVFRAGRNYYKVRLARWGIGQLLAFAGIVFWVAVFLDVELAVMHRKHSPGGTTETTQVKSFDDFAQRLGTAGKTMTEPEQAPAPETKGKKKQRVRINGWDGFRQIFVQLALMAPPWSFPLIWALKILGLLLYLVQLPLTYLVARLDYEMRWYMVTDRSLRIRHGVWKVAESTMSFANIQQVVVSQGPLQRLLGLADVRVQSAGGGGGGDSRGEGHTKGEDMHLGLFHSVTNAPEIRDLILSRLRHFRESGLGDPEEKSFAPPTTTAAATTTDGALSAARELLAEARALRAALR